MGRESKQQEGGTAENTNLRIMALNVDHVPKPGWIHHNLDTAIQSGGWKGWLALVSIRH